MAKDEKEHEGREERKCGGHVGHKGHKGLKRGGCAKASGGVAKPEKADGNPVVIKEAEADKKNIGKIGGQAGKARLDRKRGGAVHHGHDGMPVVHGGAAVSGAQHRANGGGADDSPYSSAGRALRKSGGHCL